MSHSVVHGDPGYGDTEVDQLKALAAQLRTDSNEQLRGSLRIIADLNKSHKEMQLKIEAMEKEMDREKERKAPESAQVLVYNGKCGYTVWLADTPSRMRAAKQSLFKFLAGEKYYAAGCVNQDDLERARAGDHGAISRILNARQGYEYEEWDTPIASIAEEADEPRQAE